MLKLLLLGGTAEARQLAGQLHQAGVDFTYSLAGVTRATPLPFPVRRGGFGGVDGLTKWLQQQRITLVVDVSHPYAAGISGNAAAACQQLGLPLWSWQRPPWQASADDRWLPVNDWAGATTRLADYRRALITLGSSPLRQTITVPSDALWLLRCVPGWQGPLPPRVKLIQQQGPFTLAQERALFRQQHIDVLVSRNSGGPQLAAKLQIARELGLPVLLLRRPHPPQMTREFADLDQLKTSIIDLI